MRRALMIAVLSLGLMAAEPLPAPDQPLSDPVAEARAQALFDDIRCVVCQHESIADSPAGVAADMRRLVREQIQAGASDEQIRQDLVRRFGDFVLFKPPLRPGTLLLWLGPIAALLMALALLLRPRRATEEPLVLTPEEEAQLQNMTVAETIRPDADANSPDDGRGTA